MRPGQTSIGGLFSFAEFSADEVVAPARDSEAGISIWMHIMCHLPLIRTTRECGRSQIIDRVDPHNMPEQ